VDQTANAQKLTTVDVNANVEETVNALKKNTADALDYRVIAKTYK